MKNFVKSQYFCFKLFNIFFFKLDILIVPQLNLDSANGNEGTMKKIEQISLILIIFFK
jgi:hypothetical protein